MAQPIKMQFGLRTGMGSRNHVLDVGPDRPTRRRNFQGERACSGMSDGQFVVRCAKMAEPIKMPFALWAQMGPRNHVLDGVPDLPMGRGNFWERVAHCKV